VADPAPSLRYARYMALAFEFSGTVAGGAFVGWWIDAWFGTQPYGALTCIILAVVGGFVWLVQVLRRFDRLDRAAQP
jgi:F0F1-type ATP synthase assembly protein I